MLSICQGNGADEDKGFRDSVDRGAGESAELRMKFFAYLISGRIVGICFSGCFVLLFEEVWPEQKCCRRFAAFCVTKHFPRHSRGCQ